MILLFFASGIMLRLWTLWAGRSLWYDEWVSVEISRESLKYLISWYAADVHPPLYFAILHAAIRAFGPHEWAFRLASVTGGIAALFFIYRLAGEYFGRQTAAWTLYFTAISPFFIHLASEVRNHGLPIFFCSAGSYFFARKERLLFVFAALAAVYTAHFSWFWMGAVFALSILADKKMLKTFFITFAAALPALALFIYQTMKGREILDGWKDIPNFTFFTSSKEILIVYWHFFNGPSFYMHWSSEILKYLQHSLIFYGAAALFLWCMVLVIKETAHFWKTNKAYFLFFFMLIFLPPLVIGILSPTRLETRYFAFMAPFIYMLLAKNAAHDKNRFYQWTFVALFSIISIYGDLYIFTSKTDPLHRENYLEMARYTLTHTGPKDLVQTSTVLEYYQTELGLPRKFGSISVDTSLSDWTEQTVSGYERVWLLDSQAVDSAPFEPIKQKMASLGFQLHEREKVFGGIESRAILNVFYRARV